MNPSIEFRTLGRAIGTFLVRDGRAKIMLARDPGEVALGGYTAITDGLLSTGLHVLDVGVASSTDLRRAIDYFAADGGVQISAEGEPSVWTGATAIELGQVLALIERADFECEIGQLETKGLPRA